MAQLPCQRHLFALPADAIYLNCASRSPMPLEVEKIGHAAVSQKVQPWNISDDGVHERVRELFARLLDVNADCVALTPSTSYALSQVAHNLLRLNCVSPGDSMIVLENQMSSNVYPWQRICHEVGARLVAVRTPLDGLWTEAVVTRVQKIRQSGGRVAIVAVPNFLWTDGSGPVDLERLGHLCEEGDGRRAALVVDATQSLGVVPIDVKKCKIDFLACSVHKWLFGPYGLSFLYVSESWCKLSQTEPIVQDEHNRFGADGDMVLPFDVEHGYPEEFMVGARRFDSGGRPNPILMPMIEVALKQILLWSPARIAGTVEPLVKHLAARARALNFSVPQHHAPHFVGIGPGSLDVPISTERPDKPYTETELLAAREKWADGASAFLKARKIFVSSRNGSLRVAVHVYNDIQDIDAFLKALCEFVQPLRKRAAL